MEASHLVTHVRTSHSTTRTRSPPRTLLSNSPTDRGHEKRRDHSCPHCAATFTALSSLTTHVRTVHEKRRDHACPYCAAAFGQASHLTVHVRTMHEKRRDYACPHCAAAFGYACHLTTHVRTVHEKRKEQAQQQVAEAQQQAVQATQQAQQAVQQATQAKQQAEQQGAEVLRHERKRSDEQVVLWQNLIAARDTRLAALSMQIAALQQQLAPEVHGVDAPLSPVGIAASALKQTNLRAVKVEKKVGALQEKAAKLEGDLEEATEDAQDDQQFLALFIDQQHSKMDRLKALCARHGASQHEIQAAVE